MTYGGMNEIPTWAWYAVGFVGIALVLWLCRRRRSIRSTPMARVTTTYEGIWYTHRLLWQIVEEQAALARERDREWVNPSLVAVTFAFHALEAYVNFAGEHLASDLWADEQNSFRKEPYRGWKGKLRKALELTNVPWEPDARPLKTVLDLHELRDSIAHGKAERFSGTFDHDADIDELMPTSPNSKIRSMVLPKTKLDEVLKDVRSLLDQMHPTVAANVSDPFFKATAVGGPAAWMSRSTSLK